MTELSPKDSSQLQSHTTDDHRKAAFNYQLELLKAEIDLVDRSIERDEARAHNVKNLAIVTWVATVTIFMGQTDIRKYVVATAILPILFWLMDAWWTRLRIGTHVRALKIAEYVNSPKFIDSFREYRLIDFTLLDTTGKQYRNSVEYKRWSSLGRILKFGEILFLYGGLTLLSLGLGITALIVF